MLTRVGLGPVFAMEWMIATRRWQAFAARSLFVAILLVSLGLVSWEGWNAPLTTIQQQAALGRAFFVAMASTQLVLVLLAAPAATAGAICQDKARGNLAHLLATDLSDVEIVLGKLAARLVPVFGLVACALPVMALGTLLGGIDPVALSGVFLLSLGTAALGCALAMLFSVWGAKTHEVLLTTYGVLLLWVLAGPALFLLRWLTGCGWWLPDWFTESNPFRIAFARPVPAQIEEPLWFLGATLALAAVLAAVAVVRLRPAAARWSEGAPSSRRRVVWRRVVPRWRLPRLPGPALDRNPVLWREWHRRRPSRWGRVLWGLYTVTAALISVTSIVAIIADSGPNAVEISAIFVGGQVAVGFLFLSVSSSTSLVEERVRGSLDVLLTTPVSTASIVMGKWWATYRGTVLLSILPFLVACAVAWRTEHWLGAFLVLGVILAYGAALTSLGLALATWTTRVGRAMAWTVAIDLMITVGWFFAAAILCNNSTGAGLASASPFMGTAYPLIVMEDDNAIEWVDCQSWVTSWILIDTALALTLLVATLLTFDNRLGRITEGADVRLPRRRVRPKPVLVTATD